MLNSGRSTDTASLLTIYHLEHTTNQLPPPLQEYAWGWVSFLLLHLLTAYFGLPPGSMSFDEWQTVIHLPVPHFDDELSTLGKQSEKSKIDSHSKEEKREKEEKKKKNPYVGQQLQSLMSWDWHTQKDLSWTKKWDTKQHSGTSARFWSH